MTWTGSRHRGATLQCPDTPVVAGNQQSAGFHSSDLRQCHIGHHFMYSEKGCGDKGTAVSFTSFELGENSCPAQCTQNIVECPEHSKLSL